MNHYELLCIISGKIAETEIGPIEKTIEDMLKKSTPTVHFVQHLDRKKLAYPIDHHTYGYYFLAFFDAEPSTVSMIDRALTLMNDVLRHTITQKQTVGAPPALERKQAFDDLPSLAEMPTEQSDSKPVETPSEPTPVIVASKPPTPSEPVIPAVPTPEPVPEVVKVATPAVQETSESTAESESVPHKKKQVKLSYEELDKKLDEIINNDLF